MAALSVRNKDPATFLEVDLEQGLADAALAPSNLAIYWEQLTQLLGRDALNLPARLRSRKDPPAPAWLLPQATN